MELLQCQDPAVFEAVWGRVMAGKPNPIAVGRGDVPAKVAPSAVKENPLPCLDAEEEREFLEKALLSTLETLEEFGKLEKQLPQKLKPALAPLYSARKKEFNQLETAYFLLMGENTPYPSTLDYAVPVPADKRLRHCFRQAQRWQGEFQKSALRTGDSCLTSLYLMLETAMKEEVLGLHALVEGLFWLKNR